MLDKILGNGYDERSSHSNAFYGALKSMNWSQNNLAGILIVAIPVALILVIWVMERYKK